VTAAESVRRLAESLRRIERVDPGLLEMLVQVLSFRHVMTQEIREHEQPGHP